MSREREKEVNWENSLIHVCTSWRYLFTHRVNGDNHYLSQSLCLHSFTLSSVTRNGRNVILHSFFHYDTRVYQLLLFSSKTALLHFSLSFPSIIASAHTSSPLHYIHHVTHVRSTFFTASSIRYEFAPRDDDGGDDVISASSNVSYWWKTLQLSERFLSHSHCWDTITRSQVYSFSSDECSSLSKPMYRVWEVIHDWPTHAQATVTVVESATYAKSQGARSQ